MDKKIYETRQFDCDHYGIIECVYKVDRLGNPYYDMYDLFGGYYGMLHTDNIDALDAEDIEEQIDKNL